MQFQSEDVCLYSCLVTKFVEEFECIHPRLALMSNLNVSAEVTKVSFNMLCYKSNAAIAEQAVGDF